MVVLFSSEILAVADFRTADWQAALITAKLEEMLV
jgi:hypothetical protein